MIYETPSTAIALARYLATYISDDSTILAHVRHRFGVTLSKTDMAKMRASLPKKYLPGQGNPSGWDFRSDRNFRGHIRRRTEDPLLAALASYHLKHSNLKPHEIEYYRRLAK